MEHAQSVPALQHAGASRLPSLWRPRPSSGAPLITGAAVVFGLAAAGCFYASASAQSALPSFALRVAGAVLVAATLLALFALFGVVSMRYELRDEGLVIRWLFQRLYVPYACVDGVFSGQRLGRAPLIRGIDWPGYRVGRSRSKSTGVVHYVATTQRPQDLTLITTAFGGFAISPDQPEAFRSALISHLEQSEPAPDAAPSMALSGGTWLRALGDPLGGWVTLAAALVLVITMTSLLLGGGDASGALAGTAESGTVGAGAARPVAALAVIGAALLVGNYLAGALLHRSARGAAVVFWVGGLLAQLALLVGAIRLLDQ